MNDSDSERIADILEIADELTLYVAKGYDNFLAHAYHRVENDTVWVVATERVPELVRQLRSLNGESC